MRVNSRDECTRWTSSDEFNDYPCSKKYYYLCEEAGTVGKYLTNQDNKLSKSAALSNN